jgi:hypothetical protein
MELEGRVATLEQKVAALEQKVQPNGQAPGMPQPGIFSGFKLPFTGGSRRKSRRSKKSRKSRR